MTYNVNYYLEKLSQSFLISHDISLLNIILEKLDQEYRNIIYPMSLNDYPNLKIVIKDFYVINGANDT